MEELGNMVAVGAVTPRSVRLWVRLECPGGIKVRWWPEGEEAAVQEAGVQVPEENTTDHTISFLIPEDAAKGGSLESCRRYAFEVERSDTGECVGKGSFETSPAHAEEIPERYSIAIMSCHQPFDREGNIDPAGVNMLHATRECLREHHTKMILMMGDQVYADCPKSLSLFHGDYFSKVRPGKRERLQDCTVEEVRRLYHRQYRLFWALREWRALHEAYPCYPILDDHEIVDNWGSDPAHDTPEWSSIGKGARAAYFDYQGSRVTGRTKELPHSFDYTIEYGDAAIYVLDLRSNRRGGEDGQLFSDQQHGDLERYLEGHGEKPFLFVVLSVPVVHLPRYAAQMAAVLTPSGEDFSDRWSAGPHLHDRCRFLKLLNEHQRRHPEQKVVLLSGDIHIGCVHRIQWQGTGLDLYQIISSGITHAPGWLTQWAAKFSIRINKRVLTMDGAKEAQVRLLEGVEGRTRNPYGGLNFGLIEIEGRRGNRPRARLLLYGHEGPRPVCVYRSPEL